MIGGDSAAVGTPRTMIYNAGSPALRLSGSPALRLSGSPNIPSERARSGYQRSSRASPNHDRASPIPGRLAPDVRVSTACPVIPDAEVPVPDPMTVRYKRKRTKSIDVLKK